MLPNEVASRNTPDNVAAGPMDEVTQYYGTEACWVPHHACPISFGGPPHAVLSGGVVSERPGGSADLRPGQSSQAKCVCMFRGEVLESC